MSRTTDDRGRGSSDLHSWHDVVARAVEHVVVGPPADALSPVDLLDHYCDPILRTIESGDDLWILLWLEARRAPFGDIASAVSTERARLLHWATSIVECFQRCGVVVADRDAEAVATSVLVALEALVPLVACETGPPRKPYETTRDALARRFVL